MSRDPFPGYDTLSISQNGYAYVHANPVNHTDPTGQCVFIAVDTLACGAVIIIVGVTAVATTYLATQHLAHNPPNLQVPPPPAWLQNPYDNFVNRCTTLFDRTNPWPPQPQISMPSPQVQPIPAPQAQQSSQPQTTPEPLVDFFPLPQPNPGPPLPTPDDHPSYSLYHYGTRAKIDYILANQVIPSSNELENPKRARYGNGVYFTDLVPGTRSKAQLARALYGNPWPNTQKSVEAWVVIDLSGIAVIPKRDHIFLAPRNSDLPVVGRILGSGDTP